MPKFTKLEAKPEYTKTDYDSFRAALKNFPAKYIHGRLQGAFEQYLVSKRIASFDENGFMAVISPLEFKQTSDMHARIEAYDVAKFKEDLEHFPEEKEAHQARVKAWADGLREFKLGISSKSKVSS